MTGGDDSAGSASHCSRALQFRPCCISAGGMMVDAAGSGFADIKSDHRSFLQTVLAPTDSAAEASAALSA